MDTTSPTSANAVSLIPRRFAEAWNRKDVPAVFADYAEDADFINVFGMWWHGKERFVKEHADRFATIFARSTIAFTDVKVREIPPNAAVVHGIWSLTGLRTPDGAAAKDRTGILVFMLEKRADGWRVVASQNTDIVPP